MNYQRLTQKHLADLHSLVSEDRFSTGESNLDLHARDQSRHAACRPEVVIWPEDRGEVSKILAYADRHRIPVTGWGMGTSLEGNPIPTCGGLVLNFGRMNRILEIRDSAFQADVEPGLVYQDLNEKLRLRGLFFPPDPGARASLGGMIANNSSGSRTVRYGATKDHILRLCIVLAGGEIIETGNRASKTSSGYDLVHLFVGSEGTLGIVVEATVRLAGIPPDFCAALAAFPSAEAAGRAVFQVIKGGLDPAALEFVCPRCTDLMNQEKGLALSAFPTLFMEFTGPNRSQAEEVLETAETLCREEGCTDFRSGLGRDERDEIFKARHELGEMIVRRHPDRGVMSTDVAVPINAFPDAVAFANQMLDDSGIPGYVLSHAGDGNIHLVLCGKTGDQDEWDRIDRMHDRLVRMALEAGGTATGEHGVGIGKRKFMDSEHGKALAWMRKIKHLFDPNGILNPGKIFPDSVA